MSQMEDPEQCPKCKTLAERQFLPSRLHLTSTRVTHAEFNPALGKVIQNKAHLRDEIQMHEARTGERLVEVGNDYRSGTAMVEEGKRQQEAKQQARWDKLKAGDLV